ncbi:peptidoglycan editing factor PgeF [Cohnella sp. CFH 77786]|uniref:peptidoglycan editing factor PgeF n=1 Tax=Cohnella sp. CFH 77786 TaxID=2662265 RepID=UPI001C60894D|nr:peptidoglycan editing factor PgeF [Cohnella sp. CFH 77786]MBW5444799.1 peptidoglycan editing factor PgeF [Cohnella sp. CFH 77786]
MEPFAPMGEAGETPFLELRDWKRYDGISAGFTTRQAGNTALHVGDDADAVATRRQAVAEMLGWDFAAFTCGEQVHGHHVYTVRKEDAGRGRLDRMSAIADSDALITDEPGIMLVQFFADCVPLYFLDPVTGAIGLAHAGWKGTVADIAGHTVRRMAEQYGTNPADLRSAIGPSIGPCCYEVDEAVIGRVTQIEGGSRMLDVTENGRARLDLKELNRHLMIKAGILPSRIEMSTWCTGCRTDLFFSHRAENGKTGRMMSWLGRKTR